MSATALALEYLLVDAGKDASTAYQLLPSIRTVQRSLDIQGVAINPEITFRSAHAILRAIVHEWQALGRSDYMTQPTAEKLYRAWMDMNIAAVHGLTREQRQPVNDFALQVKVRVCVCCVCARSPPSPSPQQQHRFDVPVCMHTGAVIIRRLSMRCTNSCWMVKKMRMKSTAVFLHSMLVDGAQMCRCFFIAQNHVDNHHCLPIQCLQDHHLARSQ